MNTKKYGRNTRRSWKTLMNLRDTLEKEQKEETDMLSPEISVAQTPIEKPLEESEDKRMETAPKTIQEPEFQAEITDTEEIALTADTAKPDSTAIQSELQSISNLAEDVTIQGDLHTRGNLEIHGQINGNVFSEGQVITDGKISGGIQAREVILLGAEVTGDILCEEEIQLLEQSVVNGNPQSARMTVDGRIKGDIYCSGTLKLMENSVVRGDIAAAGIAVKEGARIEGSVTTDQPEGIVKSA